MAQMTALKLKNKWSVKGIYYSKSNRQCYIDGPWRPTQQEAITAFADYVAEKFSLSSLLIFRPFLAERCDEKVAGSMDSKGNPYLEHGVDKDALRAYGVRVH